MSYQISDQLIAELKSVVEEFERDEHTVRERQIRLWKKLEFYWSGITKLWWDDVAHDWRILDDNDGSSDQAYYDKTMNVFRALLESIIAALSSTVPAVKCMPDDADNPSDILTARGGTKIAELIYKHNNAPLLWCKALYVYCTQGMIASYNQTVSDDKYGTVKVPEYEDKEMEIENKVCPECGMELSDVDMEMRIYRDLSDNELLEDEFDPGSQTVECPACGMAVEPKMEKSKLTVTRIVGVTNEAKSRQIIEVVGGLFVAVPNWARKQCDVPYLSYTYETHYTNVFKKYPHLRKDAPNLISEMGSAGANEQYERWGRLSPQYLGEPTRSTPSCRNWWLRPSAFEAIKDEGLRNEAYDNFPDGIKVVWVNDYFAEAKNESLDDHWTLTYNPLSEYIHFDPLGLLVTSTQEITEELISLTLQTIEHGIPQTFADPSVLNFKQYRETEVIPGGIYPAKNKTGKGLGDGFYQVSTATLSAEVKPFADQIQSYGQFVSGALPSLFGGEQSGSSRTAAQYSMSRNQALQRLQTPWKMINYWWAETFGKVIPAYIKTMQDDERIVKEEHNSYINILIRKSELDGKLGNVEVESADNLPATWGQIKDTVMQLIELNNPAILEYLGSPENSGIMKDVIGLSQFHVPGESDRIKQYEEIQLLLNSEPIPSIDPATGQEIELPSVQPELEVDNHQIEATICRSWLVDEAGRQAKVNNPQGYKNVLLHMKAHIQAMQQLMAGNSTPQEEIQPNNKLRPVKEANNV